MLKKLNKILLIGAKGKPVLKQNNCNKSSQTRSSKILNNEIITTMLKSYAINKVKLKIIARFVF